MFVLVIQCHEKKINLSRSIFTTALRLLNPTVQHVYTAYIFFSTCSDFEIQMDGGYCTPTVMRVYIKQQLWSVVSQPSTPLVFSLSVSSLIWQPLSTPLPFNQFAGLYKLLVRASLSFCSCRGSPLPLPGERGWYTAASLASAPGLILFTLLIAECFIIRYRNSSDQGIVQRGLRNTFSSIILAAH